MLFAARDSPPPDSSPGSPGIAHPRVAPPGRSTPIQSISILLAFAILTTPAACQFRKSTAVPDDLVGVWTTTDPKYADRFLELTKDRILFGTGEGNVDTHPIVNIEQAREEKHTLYTISYATPGGREATFSFYHDPADDGVIRFKNQQHIAWTKARQ